MAQFDEHICQVRRNLSFFQKVNHTITDSIDWQVTCCFYTAVHLINAHLSKFSLQYRSHNDVKDAINPAKQLSVSKLPDDEYVAYCTLQMLSRRSRYLVNEKDNNIKSTSAFLTYEIHLAKAIRHLDKLIDFFNSKYQTKIEPIEIKCSELNSCKKDLKNLVVVE